MVTEILPDPFAVRLAAALSGASIGASQTITVTDTTWRTGDASFATGDGIFWGFIGNPSLPASMEVVRVTQTSPTIVVTRGADGRTPVAHNATHLFGSALRGSGVQALIDQAVGAPAFSGVVTFTGVISPTALAADTNDWNPTGLSTANVIRASASGTARNLTGLVAQESGRELRVENVGSLNLTLKDADTGSSAANRFDLPCDFVLQPGAFVLLTYDGTTQRWRSTAAVNGVIVQNFGTALTQAVYLNVIGNFFSATYNAVTKAVDLEQFEPSLTDLGFIDEEVQIFKFPCRVATTGPQTLATDFENGDTIDGVVLATNDRVLIKDQASGAENGIYRVLASGAPARVSDCSTAAEFPKGFAVVVREGTANANTLWLHTTTAAITLNTTPLTFAQVGNTAPLAAHLADTTDAHDASAISFTPTGTIAATDVQAAIAEVAAEAGGGGAAFVGVRATSNGFTVPDSTVTRVILDDEDYDTDDDVRHFTDDDDPGGSGITGTVATTASSPTVTGTGTAFTTDLEEGQIISIGGQYRVIDTITNDTSLDTMTDWPGSVSGQNCYRSTGVSIITAGKYAIDGALDYGPDATGNRRLHLDLNQQGNGLHVDIKAAITGEATPLRVGGQFELAAGDALLLFTYQDSGGTRYYFENFTPFLSVQKIG